VIMFVIAHSHIQATVLLMVFILGAADGTTEIVYDTLMQLHTPRRMLAGVFAVASSVQNTGMMVGLGAAPFVLDRWGVPGVMWFFAIACVSGGLVAAAALVGRRPAGEADDDDVLRARRPVEAIAEPLAAVEPVAPPPVPAGPVVYAFPGPDEDGAREAMLAELRDEVGPLGATVSVCRDPALEAHFGGSGFGGVWIVDGGRGPCFAFPAPDAATWIPASFVVSRLRRLQSGMAA